MRRVAIIQARMTSARLPGKVLMDIAGRPMLEHVVSRVTSCEELDDVVVATTVNVDDDPIVQLCGRLNIGIHRGSELDVLSRYIGAAESSKADLVVRITSDCPLIDPAVADSVIRVVSRSVGPIDYASNTLERTFPRGLDTEAFSVEALLRAGRLATSVPAREHVTWFMYMERPDLFKRKGVTDDVDNSDLRWTVDTEEDLELVRALHSETDVTDMTPYRQLIDIVRNDPRLLAINSHIRQKDV